MDLDQLLIDRFGFPAFRPGQREAITSLLAGEDLLCIQPTGHGKSLIYQVSSVVLGGVTLVISPLLALMRDQLDHLERRFGIPAASINSDQDDAENERARALAASGHIQILFVAPEQLDNVERLAFLTSLDLRLVVVDEAHCISTWGHDFRPAYREIARLVAAVRESDAVRVLGLTATADSRTEEDIRGQLAPIRVMRRSMDRPNLALATHRVHGMGEKLAWLHDRLGRWEGVSLLYCATRDNTEMVAEYLAERGHRVAAYHAGLPPDRKRTLQAAFLDGQYAAIAATNALGMGIDKSDLRAVVHVDVPGSITACYQEVGRAGRDGLPARGELLWDPDDRRIQEYFIHSARPSRGDFEKLQGLIDQEPRRLTDLKRLSGLHPTRVTVVVAELVEQGFVVKEARKRTQYYVGTGRPGAPELTRYERQEQVRREGLARMMAYADGQTGCLMQTLRQCLGDDHADTCGRCGGCLGVPPEPLDGAQASAWLAERPVALAGYRRDMAAGRALFDSSRRSPAFRAFMGGRTQGRSDPAVLERLVAVARTLGDFVAVVPLPTGSWAAGPQVADHLARALGIPVASVLAWGAQPEARQGTLLNNDQRRANVAGRMVAEHPPDGDLLLLDDYAGSSATLREAARALKAVGHQGARIPLTVARVRWRLGRPGIV